MPLWPDGGYVVRFCDLDIGLIDPVLWRNRHK
jgi:hypothetical protein